MMDTVLNLALTFSALALSAGVVCVMAKIYAARVGTGMAVLCIVAWSTCELSLGVALLWLVHAMQRAHQSMWSTYLALAIVLVLWAATSVLFVQHEFSSSTVLMFVNFVVHFFVVGAALYNAGVVAGILVVLGVVWVTWVFCFALSLAFYKHRRVVQPLGLKIVDNLRVDTIMQQQQQQSVRRRSNSDFRDEV